MLNENWGKILIFKGTEALPTAICFSLAVYCIIASIQAFYGKDTIKGWKLFIPCWLILGVTNSLGIDVSPLNLFSIPVLLLCVLIVIVAKIINMFKSKAGDSK